MYVPVEGVNGQQRVPHVPVEGVDGQQGVPKHGDDELCHREIHQQVVERSSQLKYTKNNLKKTLKYRKL